MMSEQSPDPELRAALTSAANKINPTPPPFSAIRVAGRRRRHQRIALATAVSAVAIAGVAATALAVVPQRPQLGEPVAPPPSATTPLPSYIPTNVPPSQPSSNPSAPASSPTATASPARPCTTAQLKVSDPYPSGGMSKSYQIFMITNVSSHTCGLPDSVTHIEGTTTTGIHEPVHPLGRIGRDLNYPLSADRLAPGKQAMFEFIEGDPYVCDNPSFKTYTSVTFSIGPKATYTFDLQSDGMEIVIGCETPGVTKIGVARPPKKKTGPVYHIKATETVPKRVRGGQKINYIVTLTNKSKIAAPLVPCPTYTTELKGLAKEVTGRLDCGGQTSLAVGGSISFHLSITVPIPPQTERVPMIWWDNRFNSLAANGFTITK